MRSFRVVPVAFQQTKSEEESPTASDVPPREQEAVGDSQNIIPPASEGTPEEIWGEFFSRQTVPAELVRVIIQKLHAAGKFEHVIAALEAAISNGQVQPWMYEVLALTMEAEGRPREEVDRALLSSLDVSPQDYESTIYLAAYLVRFNREPRALKLYQEVSKSAPDRAEPYILGLRLARKLGDIDAIEWGVSGVLRHAWGTDHEVLQREAQHAAADALKNLKDKGDSSRAQAFQKTLDDARKRDLFIRVDWNGDGDLDLLVTEPDGESCDAEHPRTNGGGRFLHDGFGLETKQQSKYDSYLCREGRSGEYKIAVRYIRGNIVANLATLTVIAHQGTDRETVTKSTLKIGTSDSTKTVELIGGRLVRE